MKSRERVWRAIHHQPADRVPIDVGGTRQSGIAASTYHQLKQRLGINTPTRVFDLYQMLAEIETPVVERFGGDVIGLYRPDVAFGIVNENWKPWQTFDGTDVLVPGGFTPRVEPDGSLMILRQGEPIAHMPKGGFYFDRTEKFPGRPTSTWTVISLRCSRKNNAIGIASSRACCSSRPTMRSSLRWVRLTNYSTGWGRATSRAG